MISKLSCVSARRMLCFGAWEISPSLAGMCHYLIQDEITVNLRFAMSRGTYRKNNDFEIKLRARAAHALFWCLENLSVARWNVS